MGTAAAQSLHAEWLVGLHHVCFDKDGTLTDVHRYWWHTSLIRAQRLLERWHLASPHLHGLLLAMGVDPATQRIVPGGPIGYQPRPVIIHAVVHYLAASGVTTLAVEIDEVFRQVDAYQQRTNDYNIQVLPGVEACFEMLTRRGIAISMYTSDRKEHAMKILEGAGLMPFVSAVVGGGCMAHPKPHPEGFLLACQRVGSSPAHSAYVGDTIDDLKMGRAGGAQKVIGVGTGLGTVEELGAHTEWVWTTLSDS